MKANLLLLRNGLVMAFLMMAVCKVNGQSSVAGKINITNFDVVQQQNKVLIEWSTDRNSNSNYFEVEKSSDGKNFRTVAYVLGADPTKTDCECFGYFEKVRGKAKTSYYRLKHVDTNGNTQLSEVKLLAMK